jgi:hypothetical protein
MSESTRTIVRRLTSEEQARIGEALDKLNAPHEPGEPLDVDTFHRWRLDKLREEYPDVAELFGCAQKLQCLQS